ncbi:hypothetical protein [Caulobacter endophyticus]|uniref:PH domain-containing protein n=1 Tax=Caulobacter endophyticus TaxID=2172652 RepID=A0A2T9JJ93_9CAUL|nr:hypothetical protein [Caulobacter endophyticus]PVM83775.1 hypothetical protein DDF67_20095 [Caulobacter endophyticus]
MKHDADWTDPPTSPPALPLEVRISIVQTWIGVLVLLALTAFMTAKAPEGLRGLVLALTGGMTALSLLGAIGDTLDRRRRLVLDHDGIRWRCGFMGLVRGRAAWSELRAVAHKSIYRRPDRLLLTLDGRRTVSIPVDGLTVAGEDLPRLIRAVAPHVEISLQ